mgnify:CR=1 FL=1
MRKQDIGGVWHSGIPSWAELKKMARAGTISQALSEGDLIPIRLANGEENEIRITHDQTGNMFFVFENCLDKPFSMNAGGWVKSEMRAYLNKEIAKQLPDDLLKSIEPISIEQEIPDETCVKSRDKLFLLSEEQVFGKSRLYSIPEKGVSQLMVFKSSMEHRVKSRGGKPSWWRLRSPYSDSNASFVYVFSGGAVGYCYANYSGGVVPGFCLIEPKK